MGEDQVQAGGGKLEGEAFGEALSSDVGRKSTISVKGVKSGVEDVFAQEELNTIGVGGVSFGELNGVAEGDSFSFALLGVDSTVEGHVDMVLLEFGGVGQGVVDEEEFGEMDSRENIFAIFFNGELIIADAEDIAETSWNSA